jgi:signal transduction histidine kinase
MAVNMTSYDRNFKGGYQEQTYPVMLNGGEAGTVDIGYYGPYFFSDTDMQFIGTLNNFLIWAAAASFAACLLFGAYTARRMSKPIARVIRATGDIARGDYDSRITTNSTTTELKELTRSVNTLAETLGGQELLRKRLTADVAHELRTPLATLQSHMEAMIDGIWKPEKKRLASCHEEVLRLSKLVGELETLSRYEAENLTLHTERFDVNELLKRILTNFESGFKNKGVALVLREQPAYIEADRDKLSQVFINIISNALKFTPEGGKVDVSVTESEHNVNISVSDTGQGIPEEDIPYIFERFYRTDKSRSRATGGFGIGLTIALSIVKKHGGDINVESRAGYGSTFTVVLPASPS